MKRAFATVAVCILLCANGLAASKESMRPTGAQSSASPASVSPCESDGGNLNHVLAQWDVDSPRDLKAVVIRRHDVVVAERYYNGDSAESLHDVRSAGKSITSMLIGAAMDRNKIHHLSDPIDVYIKQAKGTPVGDITLENVLTMRSGLDANDEVASSVGNEDRLDASSDPLGFALNVPLNVPQGTHYLYNSLTAYLAGIVIDNAVGMTEEAFARTALFTPLGIERWHWETDGAGHTKGQGNLSLTAKDFAKLGQLMLNGGMYGGQRVLSQSWVDASLTPRVSISSVDPYADYYGYFWYIKTHQINGEAIKVYFASGNGGNKIYVIPSRSIVMAITSSAYGHGYGQRRSQAILKAVLAASMPDSQKKFKCH